MRRVVVLAALLFVPSLLLADVESGPKVGDKVGELKAFGVTGSVEGKEVDFAKERKDVATVYIFIQKEHFSRPIGRFLKTLDGAVKEIDEKVHIVTVFLGDNTDNIKDYLPKLQMSMNFTNTSLAVFTGEKSGPNGWGINTDAHITVAVANKAKVIANTAFTTINETDSKKVEESLKKELKKK